MAIELAADAGDRAFDHAFGPDLEADAAAGKRTLAVRLGSDGALKVSLGFTLASALVAVVWQWWAIADGAFAGIGYVVVPHAVLLSAWLYRELARLRRTGGAGSSARLDGLMVVSLAYVLWFGLLPLFQLW